MSSKDTAGKSKAQCLKSKRKSRLLMALCFGMAAFLCSVAWAQTKAPKLPAAVQKAVYAAQQSVKQKAFQKAKERLEKFLHDYPENDHYLLEFTLANVLTFSGEGKESIRHYKKALQLRPGYEPAWQNLGKVYFDLKEYDKAGDCLLQAHKLSRKKDPGLLYNVAVCYLMAGRERKALPHLEYLAGGKAGPPRMKWLEAYLKVCLDLKEKHRAVRTVKLLIDDNPTEQRWWKIAGKFYLEDNDYKKALACLTICSYLAPPKRADIIVLGDLNYSLRLPLEAAAYYQKALDQKEDASVYRKLANACIAGHRYEQAIEVLSRALKFKPSSKMWSMTDDLFYEQENFLKARQAYEESLKLDPKNGRALLMMAYCAMHMKDLDMAKKAFTKAAHFPGNRRKAREMLKKIELASTKIETR